MSNLDAIMAQYEKNQKGDSQKLSQEDRMKRYFTLLLSDKENTGQRRIRILPTTDGSSVFKETWFHELQVGGYYQKIIRLNYFMLLRLLIETRKKKGQSIGDLSTIIRRMVF
jgi:hypothetical protein